MWGAGYCNRCLQRWLPTGDRHVAPGSLPDIEMIKTCFEAGWNSALYDASSLSYKTTSDSAKRSWRWPKSMAQALRANSKRRGIEDDVGSEAEGELVPVERCVEFIEATGIDCFARRSVPRTACIRPSQKLILPSRRNRGRSPTPIVLHGGTGLSNETFKKLIAAGCAKVNISTMLKIRFADSFRNYLEAKPKEYDPMKLQKAVHADLVEMAKGFMETFGGAGRA